jgi:hypothetical protein
VTFAAKKPSFKLSMADSSLLSPQTQAVPAAAVSGEAPAAPPLAEGAGEHLLKTKVEPGQNKMSFELQPGVMCHRLCATARATTSPQFFCHERVTAGWVKSSLLIRVVRGAPA